MKVKASNGREYYLVEVIAHMLKYLKDEFIRVLRKSELELKATDFDWVITVPAIWKARGKQMMREAGYMVSLARYVSTECMGVVRTADLQRRSARSGRGGAFIGAQWTAER